MSYKESYREKIRSYIKANLFLAVNNGCKECASYVDQEGNIISKIYQEYPIGAYAKHAITCLNILKQLDKTLLKEYCLEQQAKGSKRRLSHLKITELLNFIGDNNNSLITAISSVKEGSYYPNTYAEDFLKSSIVVFNPSDFPSKQGIYVVRFLNNDKWNTLYVGKSINLKQRWTQHHRNNEIEILKKIRIQLEYRYLAETSLMKFDKPLEEIERILIDAFKPKLNNTPVLSLVN